MTAGIPGPERSLTWVNQPDAMHGSRDGTGHKPGQVRFANAVYTYRPDFKNSDYREGIIDESENHLVFEFYTPFIIGATPPNEKPWAIYESGCRNGLVLHGKAHCVVFLSVDQGRTWQDCGSLTDGMDLTDHVKGRRQYFIRFGASARTLAESQLTITTVCQANVAVLPRLRDDGTLVNFSASNRAVLSAGPNLPQSKAHVVSGDFGAPQVTLEFCTPRQRPIAAIYAAAHVASGNPPDPKTTYQIDYSIDGGQGWKPLVNDWHILRRGDEPADFWSQSFCYGSTDITEPAAHSAQVRFSNNGGKKYLRGEVHLVYGTSAADATKVTFDWTESGAPRRESSVFPQGRAAWQVKTGREVQTRWVEMEPVVAR
ncbi:MAG: hypothetical protein ACR2OZ_13175 [Verrucomicrobiales bacterium]